MRMDNSGDPSGGPIQGMLNTAYSGLAAAVKAIEPWLRAAARGNIEAFTLMNRRAQAYMELPMRLSQCRSPQDLANEQMRFWQTMARQYTESSQRVLGAWFEMVQKSAGKAKSSSAEHERDYITFPEPEETGSSAERRAA